MDQSFSLLIKPASFDCNLRCSYCFYLPKAAIFGPQPHRMSRETLQKITANYLALALKQHTFGWQGGEPALMTLDFFRQAVRLQQQYGRGKTIANSLQTNGTLLNDGWGKFLHDQNFLVGISIDGPAELHDRFRQNAGGAGSHGQVMQGLAVLQRHRVEFNALTLVSAANQKHAVTVYRYLKKLGIHFHQYIECVEFDQNGQRQPYALAPGEWGKFLCQIFDEWFAGDVGKVSVRLFDSILSRLATGVPTVCPMAGNCCNYLVVEHNGDVYPCDFFVKAELKLGNINQSSFAELRALPGYRDWGMLKNPRQERCSRCRYLPLCMGDCPKHRTGGFSTLCQDWQMFYDYTIGRFEAIAQKINDRSIR